MKDTRTKILDAASELFLEKGAAGLSVRAIANRAGLSTIGIYSHFQGKQGILDTLYIEGFDLVYKAMDVATDNRADSKYVIKSCERYLDVATQHEAHYRLIFGESGTDFTPSKEAQSAAARARAKLVANMGEFLQQSGLAGDKFSLAMDIWAIVHGYVSISHHALAETDWDWKALALKAVSLHLIALQRPE